MSKGINQVHPEIPGAVGSRNSVNRGSRDEYKESQLLIDEEVDKVLNHISSKLPPEVLEKLDVQAGIKSKLHNYYNQSMQNMFNRYLTTVEDELSKKFRDLVDRDEQKNLAKYTPRAIAEILEAVGGNDKFNTSEIEQSIVNIYGHCQGAIQRGVSDLEQHTNSLLRQKMDVGAFMRGENAYAIVKCSFRNHNEKPKTVYDATMAINVLDAELISPIMHIDDPVKDLLLRLVSNHVHEKVDEQITKINDRLVDEGKENLSDNSILFEKFKELDSFLEGSWENEDFTQMSKNVSENIMNCLSDTREEFSDDDLDSLSLKTAVKTLLDNINLRHRGFNTALNSLTSILDTSKMGYQYIENFKNKRICLIKEYSEADTEQLPDERYAIRLEYFDKDQLHQLCQEYEKKFKHIVASIDRTCTVVEKIFINFKKDHKILDFTDLQKEYAKSNAVPVVDEVIEKDDAKTEGTAAEKAAVADEPIDLEEEKVDSGSLWNELAFISPKDTQVEKLNKTNRYNINVLRERIVQAKGQVQKVFGQRTPEDRLIVSEHLKEVEEEFNAFAGDINPYHIQPGVLLRIDITSIKRKQVTMYGIANVLNEFLNKISSGFSDQAFAQYSRRRSTVREDIDETFSSANLSTPSNPDSESETADA